MEHQESVKILLWFGESIGFWIQTGAFLLSAFAAVWVVHHNGAMTKKRATIDHIIHQKSDKGDGNYKHTVLGSIVISHQCKIGERCSRCSSSILSLPQIVTPFSYGASSSRATVRIPFQKKFPARFNIVSTVLSRYPFHDFSSPAQ